MGINLIKKKILCQHSHHHQLPSHSHQQQPPHSHHQPWPALMLSQTTNLLGESLQLPLNKWVMLVLMLMPEPLPSNKHTTKCGSCMKPPPQLPKDLLKVFNNLLWVLCKHGLPTELLSLATVYQVSHNCLIT